MAQISFYDAFVEFQFENRYADGLRIVGTNENPRGLWLTGENGKLFVSVHGAELLAERSSNADINTRLLPQMREPWTEVWKALEAPGVAPP